MRLTLEHSFWLLTKLYGSMGDWPNENLLSALNIRNAVEGSLRRLQTDYIDLYQMHHIDRSTPWEEIWEAFSVLRQQGKVLYFGSSNFAGWHLDGALRRLVGPRLTMQDIDAVRGIGWDGDLDELRRDEVASW